MASGSRKKTAAMAYPKTLLSIVASLGGLAIFLILASSSLISGPFRSGGIVNLIGTASDEIVVDFSRRGYVSSSILRSTRDGDDFQESDGGFGDSRKAKSISQDNRGNDLIKNQPTLSGDKNELIDSRQQQEVGKDLAEPPAGFGSRDATAQLKQSHAAQQEKGIEDSSFSTGGDGVQIALSLSSNLSNTSNLQMDSKISTRLPSLGSSLKDVNPSPPMFTNSSPGSSVDSGCNLYHGKWVYDSGGPLYKNDSCPVLTQTQNCQGNGRPDTEYEHWRWKPTECDLPRFDARRFLDLMKGKTIAFIGDSIARNQMESMLCILWQVEVPKNRGNRRMQRFYFASTSTTIIRIWSAWLVNQTSEPFDFAPAGVAKLQLDAPDESFMEFITDYDVIVLSSGHWFAKQSVYILQDEIVGGQLWWPDKSKTMKINNIEAFGVSVETALTAMARHPDYTGLTIVRTFSPDHYGGGNWNAGGSCTGKVRPLKDGELVEDEFTNVMHQKQVTGFSRAVKKKTNKSKLKLMDITEAFEYRHDGHPGPHRSTDPNKITKRGPDGRPPPQDCLHWCMPGPVDTWNEILFEIIKREL
nr:protein YLS7-like [Coffea arabica]